MDTDGVGIEHDRSRPDLARLAQSEATEFTYAAVTHSLFALSLFPAITAVVDGFEEEELGIRG